jgi:hypothetical protein
MSSGPERTEQQLLMAYLKAILRKESELTRKVWDRC